MKYSKLPLAFELFLAGRIIRPDKKSFSGPIIFISILSLVFGLSVMIISVVVLTGFKKEIREKVSGFTGHIHIAKYNSNNSLERPPIFLDSLNFPKLQNIRGVQHLQSFITKAAILRTKDDIHGLIVKGVGADFDTTFFANNLLEGRMPKLFGEKKTNDVLISKTIANQLHLKMNDLLRVYFVNTVTGKIRGRRLHVCGIYHTSVEEFDNRLIIGDIRHLQKLNNWQPNQVTGVEVILSDFSEIANVEAELYDQIPYDMNTETIQERYPQIFDWLQLQDINVIIILVLIILVATVSMISTLLVLILERTQMIGILKSLGATNKIIRNVFIVQAAYIVIIGLFFGNLLGIGLSFLQQQYGLVELDPGTYYMAVVPINLDFFMIALINLATLVLVLLFMVFPVLVISRISPVKAIRFD